MRKVVKPKVKRKKVQVKYFALLPVLFLFFALGVLLYQLQQPQSGSTRAQEGVSGSPADGASPVFVCLHSKAGEEDKCNPSPTVSQPPEDPKGSCKKDAKGKDGGGGVSPSPTGGTNPSPSDGGSQSGASGNAGTQSFLAALWNSVKSFLNKLSYSTNVDADGDGKWDQYKLNWNDDGSVDIYVDMNGDGRADFVGHDKDANRLVDDAHYDNDFDGCVETYSKDNNGDGWQDAFTPYNGTQMGMPQMSEVGHLKKDKNCKDCGKAGGDKKNPSGGDSATPGGGSGENESAECKKVKHGSEQSYDKLKEACPESTLKGWCDEMKKANRTDLGADKCSN